MEHIKDILDRMPKNWLPNPVVIYAFSFKNSRHKIPNGTPILDCRTMKNCFSVSKAQAAPQFPGLVAKGINILERQKVIACGCDYGKHRSVAVAEEIAKQTQGRLVKL